MSKKGSVKLSEEELIEMIAKREKFENRLAVFSNYALIIGLVGGIIFLLVGISALALLFWVVCALGAGAFLLWDAHRNKTASMVDKHLDDFQEAELQKAFGPCLKTSEMNIDKQLMEKLRPVNLKWDECDVWRFYESNYHGIHFSAANVRLNEVTRNYQDGVSRSPRFEGAVLRCKDICAPALDNFLLGSRQDHHSCDLMEPAVFRQYFSALTADGQSADILVTPQMRELIQKLESLGKGYQVVRLLFRDGEAILVMTGYTFAQGIRLNRSMADLDEIRSRFKDSLTHMGNMIDVLRDFGGKS